MDSIEKKARGRPKTKKEEILALKSVKASKKGKGLALTRKLFNSTIRAIVPGAKDVFEDELDTSSLKDPVFISQPVVDNTAASFTVPQGPSIISPQVGTRTKKFVGGVWIDVCDEEFFEGVDPARLEQLDKKKEEAERKKANKKAISDKIVRGRGSSRSKKSKTNSSKDSTNDQDSTGGQIVPVKEFRLSAKNLFLTYPKCDLTLMECGTLLFPILNKYGIKDFAFCREKHEDLSLHIHAYIKLEKKLDVKKADFLDLVVEANMVDGSVSTVRFHGNYAPVRSDKKALEYITKEVFTTEDAIDNLYISPGLSKQLGEIYQHIGLEMRMILLSEKGKIDEAMKLFRDEDPKGYVRIGEVVQRRLQGLYLQTIGFRAKYPFDSYFIPPDLQQVLDLFEQSLLLDDAKVLVIQGYPGTGKTQFLLAYLEQKLGLRVLVINNREGLAKYNPSKYDAIIYDDPDIKNESREQLIALCDNLEQVVKIRYTNVVIPKNTPKAFIVNKDLSFFNPAFIDPALMRRVISYKLPNNTSLFDRDATVRKVTGSDIYAKQKELNERIELYRKYEIEKNNKEKGGFYN